jgi:hypothetical protein
MLLDDEFYCCFSLSLEYEVLCCWNLLFVMGMKLEVEGEEDEDYL